MSLVGTPLKLFLSIILLRPIKYGREGGVTSFHNGHGRGGHEKGPPARGGPLVKWRLLLQRGSTAQDAAAGCSPTPLPVYRVNTVTQIRTLGELPAHSIARLTQRINLRDLLYRIRNAGCGIGRASLAPDKEILPSTLFLAGDEDDGLRRGSQP